MITVENVITGYADDPRIKWLEPNREVSLPDPVPEETRKKIEEK